MNLSKFLPKRKPHYALMRGEVDGLPFVAHYDFGLLKFKSKNKYPYMLGVSIQGFELNSAKLPTSDARPAIDTYEDELIATIEAHSDCVYAGHNFWNSALEVIFYVASYDKLIEVLEKKAGKSDEGLWFTFKIDSDPGWYQLENLTQH